MSRIDAKALSARNERARHALLKVVQSKDLDEARRIAGAELGVKGLPARAVMPSGWWMAPAAIVGLAAWMGTVT